MIIVKSSTNGISSSLSSKLLLASSFAALLELEIISKNLSHPHKWLLVDRVIQRIADIA